ncbi:MAG: C4-dicarboxylate ABC transporter, partial [Rhodoferax sp.]
PFVLIQIIMVSAIIFFPGIVSSGLDKAVAIDMNKVELQMEKDSQPAEMPAAEAPEEGASAPASTDTSTDENDPMKAMQDSMAKDSKKK